MESSVRHARPEPALVKSGAGIYAGAATVGAIEAALPGGPTFSAAPEVLALLMIPLIAFVGPRLPRKALFALGPLGAALIAFAVATSVGYSDAAILYCWPVLWVGYFFSTRSTALVVGCIGVAHAVALVSMPAGVGNVDRWIDVMASISVAAVVVRALVARNERLVHQLIAEARIDPLTELLNRRGLAERFDHEIARATRSRTSLAVVAIDIDHFKRINDTHGHEAGDRALIWVANRLAEQTRGADITARTGGEEFLVVLPGASTESAYEFAERLRQGIADHAPFSLTISAGVAAAIAPNGARLTEAADQALYAAKRGGRNTTRTAAQQLQNAAEPTFGP
jgi:diguanylate cyclase (GGDEF)-like protein